MILPRSFTLIKIRSPGPVPLYRHIQLVIVAMPVLVGALAEHLKVLFLAPSFYIELVCGIKRLSPGQVNHCRLKFAAKIR